MPHICVSESGKHGFRWWIVVYSAPSHYLKQCWDIVNWTLRHKLQWKCNQNTNVCTHENASENIVCEMATIFSRGRWAKKRFPLKSVRGKRSRHPRCMRNPQFCVSGNRPIQDITTKNPSLPATSPEWSFVVCILNRSSFKSALIRLHNSNNAVQY